MNWSAKMKLSLGFKFKPSNEIYNYIRSKNFEFFNENKRTGKKEIDAIIASCTHR